MEVAVAPAPIYPLISYDFDTVNFFFCKTVSNSIVGIHIKRRGCRQ